MNVGLTKRVKTEASSMLTQLSGEVPMWVTTDRRHKQWWAISGRRVGNGGKAQGGAGNALDETHSYTEHEWKHRAGPPR